jgi:diguanylate cyclase
MTDDAQRWKEKYLKSIEQQEKLERRWNARLDLLRRGLVRSTLAAEGSDRAVDACMKEMREVVRTDDMDAKLAALIPRLEKAVLDSEQRRETRVEQTSTALGALVSQLQALPLPKEVSRPLKKLAKSLDERAGQAREIPLLLSELSALQGQALAVPEGEAHAPRPGLLQRLFGGREAEPEPEPAAEAPAGPAQPQATPPAPAEPPLPVVEPVQPAVAKPEPEPELVQQAAVDDAAAVIAAVVQAEPSPVAEPSAIIEAPVETLTPTPPAPVFLDTLPLPSVMAEAIAAIDPQTPAEDVLYALPESPEPSYSSVATHIESTLLGLLDELALPERHQPQADAMRLRLEHGLNWYELLPILDDLAVLMLAINDSGQHEFETYLKQLNQRLEVFQSHLQVASEGHADGRVAAQELENQLREQVGGLQSSVQGVTDVGSLKHILESRLEGLLGTMDEHRQQRDVREQEVAAKLQGLAERVANMEQEALGYREHLEEQRQKALIDPLTGLPNRAAWSERLEHEESRWREGGGELLLAMLDLDHFKSINDSYGHQAGDKVLKIIAGELRKRLRPHDFIARFGGEEFVLLMPGTSLKDGIGLMERLRAAIEACPFHFKGQRVTITVSSGVAAFRSAEQSAVVLKRADQALYRAKSAGRNQVQAG